MEKMRLMRETLDGVTIEDFRNHATKLAMCFQMIGLPVNYDSDPRTGERIPYFQDFSGKRVVFYERDADNKLRRISGHLTGRYKFNGNSLILDTDLTDAGGYVIQLIFRRKGLNQDEEIWIAERSERLGRIRAIYDFPC